MSGVLWCVLALISGQVPGMSRGNVGNIHTSWISGRVHTKDGDPVPVAVIVITLVEFQDGRPANWPGAVLHVQPNGVFRVQVPSDAAFRVCASVPTKQDQCQAVRVEGQDLEVADFAF